MGTRIDSFSFQKEGEGSSKDINQHDQDNVKTEGVKPTGAVQHGQTLPQRIGMLSTQSSFQSLYQENERPTLTEKKPRAVFNDLHTAHTSITGSATSRYQGIVPAAPAFNEDESSIALTDLSAFDDSSSNLLPIPSRPAVVFSAVSSLRRARTSDNEILPEPKRRSRPGSWFEKRSGSGTPPIAQNVSRVQF